MKMKTKTVMCTSYSIWHWPLEITFWLLQLPVGGRTLRQRSSYATEIHGTDCAGVAARRL